jgi:predicted RNA-binding protein YlxR (DUF448 family)
MRTKHVPVRTCLGCGQRRPKEALMRIVLVDGVLTVDECGRLPGRGTYLCPEAACISSLRKKRGRLSYSLRVAVPRAAEDTFLTGLLQTRDGEE